MIIILWWFRLISTLYTGRHLTSGPVRELYNMSNYQTTVNLIEFYQKEVAWEWVKIIQAFILTEGLTRIAGVFGFFTIDRLFKNFKFISYCEIFQYNL